MLNNIFIFNILFISLINIFLLTNQITKVSSVTCKISVPDSVTSQKFDNVICIGTSGFTFPNYASFSDGSLIIESSRDVGTSKRFFMESQKTENLISRIINIICLLMLM